MLLTSRKLIQRKLLDVECDMRRALRNFRLKIGAVRAVGHEAQYAIWSTIFRGYAPLPNASPPPSG